MDDLVPWLGAAGLGAAAALVQLLRSPSMRGARAGQSHRYPVRPGVGLLASVLVAAGVAVFGSALWNVVFGLEPFSSPNILGLVTAVVVAMLLQELT